MKPLTVADLNRLCEANNVSPENTQVYVIVMEDGRYDGLVHSPTIHAPADGRATIHVEAR